MLRCPVGRSALPVALALASSVASEALALPGTHPEAISTFDTRGSTVVMAYRQGLVFDGTSRVISYNANFTATSGNFSAQFGAHYLQLELQPDALMMHGAAASGVALFSIPVSRRHDNGVPLAALDFYFGAVPTAAVSGPENFMSLPANLGLGVSLSPAGWLTVTPWFEASPSVDLDTRVSDLDFTAALRRNVDAADPDADEITLLTDEDIQQVLRESVELELSTNVAMRGGVQAIIHLGPAFDLNAYFTATTFGSAFSGQFLAQGGLGLSYHWDDLVPEVLPAEKRLRGESCDDVERRFMVCPNYRRPASPTEAPTEAAPAQPPPPVDAPRPAPSPEVPAPPSSEPTAPGPLQEPPPERESPPPNSWENATPAAPL